MLVFACLASGTLNAQTKAEKKLLKKGRKELAKGDYHAAKDYYLQLLELNGEDPDYLFETGLAYYNSNQNRDQAVGYFEKALAFSKTDTIAEIFYYLGRSNQFIGEFEKAINYYNQFRDFLHAHDAGVVLGRDVSRFIEMCNYGTTYMKEHNDQIIITNVGEMVNSDFPEYAPVVNQEENIIIYTARKSESTGGKFYHDNKHYEDIFVSYKENEEWVEATKFDAGNDYISSNINSKWHDAAIAYSQDETALYIYRKNDVWESELVDGKWTDPVRMNTNINTKGHEPSIYLNADNTVAILTSNRKGGFGGRDLWMSERTSDGTWGEVINLGSIINTEFDEDAPFLTPDGNTLFFSSTGHTTMGGYDVFSTVKGADGKWGPPVNLGSPINTAAHDIYYTQNIDSTVAYISSDRAYGFGDMDIYRVQLKCQNLPFTEIRGLVLAGNELDPITGGKVEVFYSSGEKAGEFPIDENGKYLMVLPPEQSYELKLTADNYYIERPHEESFTLPGQCEYFQLFQEVTIKRYDDEVAIETGDKFNEQRAVFHDAFFDIKSEVEEYYDIVDLHAQNGNNQLPINDTANYYNLTFDIMHNDIIPAKDVEVSLINSNGEIFKTSYTDYDGNVTFYNLREDLEYSIVINEYDAQMSYYGMQEDLTTKSIIVKGEAALYPVNTDISEITTIPAPEVEILLVNNNNEVINIGVTGQSGLFNLDNLPTDEAAINEINSDFMLSYQINEVDEDFAYSMYIKTLDEESNEWYSEYVDIIKLPEEVLPLPQFANILFDFDKYFLRDQSKATLDKIIAFMEVNPEALLKVAGHTDWMGTDEYNEVLSENRATSAYDYLAKNGIIEARMEKVWFGEGTPTVPNELSAGIDDPIGRQLNRRCEFEITIPAENVELVITF